MSGDQASNPAPNDLLDSADGLTAYLPDFAWAPIAGTDLEGHLDSDGQRTRLVYRRRHLGRRATTQAPPPAAGGTESSETEHEAEPAAESEAAQQRRLALERFAVLDACLLAVEHPKMTTDVIAECEDFEAAVARLAQVFGVQPRWARAMLGLNWSVLTRSRGQQLRDDLAGLRAHLESLGEQLPRPQLPDHPVTVEAGPRNEPTSASWAQRARRRGRVVGARWWRWLRSAPVGGTGASWRRNRRR